MIFQKSLERKPYFQPFPEINFFENTENPWCLYMFTWIDTNITFPY